VKSQSGKILQTVRLRGRNSETLRTIDRGYIGNLSRPSSQLVGDNVDTSPKSYVDILELSNSETPEDAEI
jgi:hypothetical protein